MIPIVDTSARGWDELIERYWSRMPCKLAHRLPVSVEQLLQWSIAYAKHSRTPGRTREVILRTWADGHFVFDPKHLAYCPADDDTSVVEYAERVRRLSRTSVFGVNHLKLQVYGGWSFWESIVGLLAPVTQRVGIPYGGAECSCLVGADQSLIPALHTYSRWEHAPRTGHFVYQVFGRARFVLDDAEITLEPGELLYLPNRDTLQATFDGIGAAVVINLRAGSARERADRMVRELVIQHRYPVRDTYPHHLHRSIAIPEHVPPALEESVATMLDYSSSPQFALQLVSGWMCFESSLGFARSPLPEKGRTLELTDSVCRSPTLRWETIDTRIVASANGHALRFPSHPSVIALLERLDVDVPLEVGTLEPFADSDDGPGEEELFTLLQALYEIHGVASVKPDAS
jgi:hypothetical protein